MNRKKLVMQHRQLVGFACSAANLLNAPRVRRKGSGNRIDAPCALLKKVRIRIHGSNNCVDIGDFSILEGVSIDIRGDNNTITIGEDCRLVGTEFCIEDSGNTIAVGDRTRILGKTELAAIEGTRIAIGDNCLFSSDIHFRTGDSHSVLNLEGRRINASEDITIGSHVWVGRAVTCLKGATVPDHSIVGASALVTGKFRQGNCVLGGVPAKIVKQGVDWSISRVSVGEIAPDFLVKSEYMEGRESV